MADIRIEEKKRRGVPLILILLLIVIAALAWWLYSQRSDAPDAGTGTTTGAVADTSVTPRTP